MKTLSMLFALAIAALGFERIFFAMNHGLGSMPMGGYQPVLALGLGFIICGAALAVISARMK